MEVDGAKSSAWQRRQRRLRSWLKHERQTVAMALAECLHHSAQRPVEARAREVEEQDKNNASRRQKAPPPGMHPGVLKEPEVQGSLVAPLRPGSGAAPGLALPSLIGASGEAVDASSLAVLLQFSLGAEEEEAKEERKAKYKAKMQVINRRVSDGTATPAQEAAWRRWISIEQSSSSTSNAQRRKRKKKKRRKRTRRRR